MGWGKMLLLGNVGQQMDIEEIRDYLRRAIDEINKGEQVNADQAREIERLRGSLRELQLYLLGLGRLLARKGMLTEEELETLVTEVERTSK